jgi:hypothetical protein
MAQAYYMPLGQVFNTKAWPSELLSGDGTSVLDKIFVSEIQTEDVAGTVKLRSHVLIAAEASFGIPGLPWLTLALSPTPGGTDLPVEVTLSPFKVEFKDLPIVARVSKDILQPMASVTKPDLTKQTTDIVLGKVTLGIGEAGVALSVAPGISLPLCMVGTSGVIVSGGTIGWLNPGDPTPTGASAAPPPGFSGLYIDDATINLPDVDFLPTTFAFDDCYIGTGGFTGTVTVSSPQTWDTVQKKFTTGMAGDLFGFQCGLKQISISFYMSALQKGSLLGEVFVPYLDKRIGVELKLSLAGDFTVALAAPQSTNPDPNVAVAAGGLLDVKEPNLLEAQLDSIAFEKIGDDYSVRVTGKIKPLLGGIEWPQVELKGLTIHSDGRVDLGGSWIDLPQQKGGALHGFPLEIRKVGFGSENGKNWIGFSGGVKLVDGLPVGGGVEGLKLKWDAANPGDTSKYEIELRGIEVALDIPDVLTLNGKVVFFEDKATQKTWFQGSATATIAPLNLTLDCQLLVGRTPKYSFFYIFLEVGLPAGIPLFQTGLALYGLGGLFGYNVKPDRRSGEPWYEGWYKRSPVGPTGASKWTDQEGRLAFGASVTIGTLPDNGFSVNARVLVILLIPGPMILIEGKANLVKDRKAVTQGDPLFRALAVIDGEAGTFLVNVEPHFVYPQTGDVLDITGIAEGFFDFNNSDRWYLNVGVRDPREKRIRASIIKLFKANAYLMLNPERLALGAYVGIDEKYSFGPVGVRVAYYFEADAELVFRPLQLQAEAGLHGRVEIKAFGFGVGAELDAQASMKTPTPFEFHALLHAKADLPWPLPDPGITIPFDYVEPAPPPLPVPLQNVEVATRKASESWDVAVTQAAADLVPVDGKPVLVFSKPMHDDAGIGGNIQATGNEKVGDLTFDYHLDSLTLQKLESGAWVTKAGRPTPTGAKDLYGMWMPITGGDSPPNSKLMLLVKTPFDSLKDAASSSAAEEFAQKYPDYPCVVTCVDFEDAPVGDIASDLHYRGLTFTYDLSQRPNRGKPGVHDPRGTTGGSHQFRWFQRRTVYLYDFTGPTMFSLSLPEPALKVRLRLTTGAGLTLNPFTGGQKQAVALPDGSTAVSYTGGTALPPVVVPHVTGIDDHEMILDTDGITRIEFVGAETDIFEVCWIAKAAGTGVGATPGTSAYNAAEAQRWKDEEFLFEPNATYRLTTKTHVGAAPGLLPGGWPVTVDAGPLGPASISQQTGLTRYDFDHTIYFRTQGPPGYLGPGIDRRIGAAAMPPEAGAAKPGRSAARSLQPYVARTVPENDAAAVYRAYDVAVEFNEPYVKRMYDEHGSAAKLYLRDRNDDPPGERIGGTFTTGTIVQDWIEADAERLTPAESMWSAMITDTACEIVLPPKPSNDQLNASLAGPVLLPKMMYRATLEPDPAATATDAELYTWSFGTSRFATFAHHVHSFLGRVWDSDAVLDSPRAALTTTEQTALRAAAQQGKPADFETLASLFQRPVGVLPDALEVTLLRDAAGPWGFLVESPEPLDGQRVTATLRSSPTPTTEAIHRGPVQLRDVAFGNQAGTNYNTEWVELIVVEPCAIAGLMLEHLADPTQPEVFTTLDTITGSGRFEPGDIIRIHAGIAPPSPPDDGRQHLYLTAVGGTPTWMLHAGRDVCRLVDANGIEVDRQEFLASYTTVSALWIWNADRTRAFVIPSVVAAGPTSDPVPSGTYRIQWQFARDISTAVPGAPILRQSGRKDPEAAVTQFSV